MEPVRIAVVGIGVMGRLHVEDLCRDPNAEVVALADVIPDRAQAAADAVRERTGRTVPVFDDYTRLLASRTAEAILIATPHPSHPEIAIAAFQERLHVLCEKPIATRISDARRINEAAARAGTVFGVMLQHRMDGTCRRLRRALQEGELGRLTRMHYVTTDWYRTQSYYDSGVWRGTWAGEGGGVLMNQAPHDLDQIVWQMGPLRRVSARCRTSDFHRIQVEDDAEALLDFASGAVGFFSTATCEMPGVRRLEIYGDRGLIVCTKDKVLLRKTDFSIREQNMGDPLAPESLTAHDDIELDPDGPVKGEHIDIARNFCRAIRTGEPLIAPGPDAYYSLELANAMVLSSERQSPVDLPLDPSAYDELADRMMKKHAKPA